MEVQNLFTIIIIGGNFAILVVGWFAVQTVRKARKLYRLPRRFYRITFPQEKFEHEDTVKALSALYSYLSKPRPFEPLRTFVSEMSNTKGTIEHVFAVPADLAIDVPSLLRPHIPGAVVEEIPTPEREWTASWRLTTHSNWVPFYFSSHDAVAADLLTGATRVKAGEGVGLQVVFSPSWKPVKAKKWATKKEHEKKPQEKKLEGHVFIADIRIMAKAATRRRAVTLMHEIYRGFRGTHPEGNFFRRSSRLMEPLVLHLVHGWHGVFTFSAFLNVAELAVYIAWPFGDPQVDGLPKVKTQHMDVPANVSRNGIVLGMATRTGEKQPVAVKAQDLTQHMHVIGQIGTGKSTVLLNASVQMAQAGSGFLLIDPHGDLAQKTLERIPAHRVNDVIWFDPTDEEWTVPFDIFSGHVEQDTLFIMGVLNELYHMENMNLTAHLARKTVETVASQGLTLLDIPDLLATTPRGQRMRTSAIAKSHDRYLQEFWEQYQKLGESQKLQQSEPLARRIGAFRHYPSLRAALSIRGTGAVSLPEAIAGRKIILVSLPKRVAGEVADFFGALLFAKATRVLEARALGTDRTPYGVIVDEIQNFARTPHLPEAFDEVRKYGGQYIVAHQYIRQLTKASTELYSAIMTNARNKVIMQVSAEDSRELMRQLGSRHLAPDAAVMLEAHMAIARLVVDGSTVAPTTIRTLPEPERTGLEHQIIETSRRQYGRRREDILKEDKPARKERAPIGMKANPPEDPAE